MTVVSLKIVEPVNDTAYIGTPTVTFRGIVADMPTALEAITLYYRWYSSLNPDSKQDHYAMNTTPFTDAGSPFSAPLNLGSHVISLAVTDRSEETMADMQATQHGGMTGGSKGDARCVIHVFKANLIGPTGGPLSKNNATLIAEAPLAWGQARLNTSNPVVFDIIQVYATVNRLQYRWEFIPNLQPGGADQRQTVNFMPPAEQYVFGPDPTSADPDRAVMTLKYVGPLPASLNGNYRLILHVEDRLGVLGGHEASVSNLDIS